MPNIGTIGETVTDREKFTSGWIVGNFTHSKWEKEYMEDLMNTTPEELWFEQGILPPKPFPDQSHPNWQHVVYFCGQLERGEDGRLHWQMYFKLKKQLRYNAIRELFLKDTYNEPKDMEWDHGLINWTSFAVREIPNDKPAAWEYALKEHTRIHECTMFEFGERPKIKGSKRKIRDNAEVQEELLQGMAQCRTWQEVLLKVPDVMGRMTYCKEVWEIIRPRPKVVSFDQPRPWQAFAINEALKFHDRRMLFSSILKVVPEKAYSEKNWYPCLIMV